MLLRKFGLVVWKNLLLRKRHWIVTLFEIVIPVALFILAAVTQSQLKTSAAVIRVLANYRPIQNENIVTSYILSFCNKTVLYAPNNTFTSSIMDVTSNGNAFFGK
jgi:ATP-binding cassette subfamily A (ABC1) protein 3